LTEEDQPQSKTRRLFGIVAGSLFGTVMTLWAYGGLFLHFWAVIALYHKGGFFLGLIGFCAPVLASIWCVIDRLRGGYLLYPLLCAVYVGVFAIGWCVIVIPAWMSKRPSARRP